MRKLVGFICIVLALAGVTSAFAAQAPQSKEQWWPGQGPTPTASGTLSGQVTGITATTLTVQTTNNGTPIFTLNPDTCVKGTKTSITDVAAGDQVTINYRTLRNGNVLAATITVSAALAPGQSAGSVYGTVSAVSATAITITTDKNGTQTCAVTASTAVSVKGVTSTIDQVQTGSPAIVAFQTTTATGPVATSIRVLAQGAWPLSGNVSGTVGAIDTSNITVQTANNGAQTFGIVAKTKVAVYGEKTTLDQIKTGDNIEVHYKVADDGTRTAESIAVPVPVYTGKIADFSGDGFDIAATTGSIHVSVTSTTKIFTHTYDGTIADLQVGCDVTVHGVPTASSVQARRIGFNTPEIKGVVLSASGNAIVVQTARKKARNVVGSAATVILVRPKSAPNYAGTPADVKVGATVHIGGFITSAGVMNAFWIDVLVP